MVRKLRLVVDNGPIRRKKTAQEEWNTAYMTFLLACWGILRETAV